MTVKNIIENNETVRLGQNVDVYVNKSSTITYNLYQGEVNPNYREYWENLVIRYFNTTGITEIDHTAAFLSGLEGDALNVPTITLSNLELAPGVREGVIRKAWLKTNFIPKNVHLEAIPLENLDKIRDELLANLS